MNPTAPITPAPANAAVCEPSELARLALRNAVNQLGQSERPLGSNRGPMVDRYLASVGLRPGFSWCQAFVFWCFDQAIRGRNTGNPVVRTGGVLACWNNTSSTRRITRKDALQKPDLVRPGAQFFMDFGGGMGHTGFVEAITGDSFITIEGNSNTNGSRNGVSVVRHKRRFDDALIKGYVNY